MINATIRYTGLIPVFFLAVAAMHPSGPPPRAPDVVALRGLEKGRWELREKGPEPSKAIASHICVGDAAQLLKLRHGRGECRHYVIDNTSSHAIVTYECEGSGFGRTDLRVETPRLVQIDSQGVVDGEPFAVKVEARQTGSCQ